MLARIWNVGDPIQRSDAPLFFKVSDQSAALAAILASECCPPAYAVAPNGEPLIELIGPYVQWLQSPSLRTIVLADYSSSAAPVADVLGLCASVCTGLREYAADKVISACSDLSSLLTCLPATKRGLVPPKLGLTAEFLRDFATDCLKPLEYGTPFVHMGTSQQHKKWWTASASHRAVLGRYKKRYKVDFGGMPGALKAVDQWLDAVDARISRLQASPPTPASRQDAIVEASAYCGAIAERHLMRSHQGQAILHLHRSLDLLLFSVCDARRMIDHTQHGSQYAASFAPSKGSNRISLTNSLDAVGPYLSQHPTRESEFVNLNEWRNLLMHTHYMSGLDDTTARQLFRTIRPHLLALGGSQWREAHEVHLRGVELSLVDLLDVDQSLSSAVQHV